MSQQQKSAYWKALKEHGVTFEQHYREYSTEDLAAQYAALTDGATPPVPQPKSTPQFVPPAPMAAPVPKGEPTITEEEFRSFQAWKKQQQDAAHQAQLKQQMVDSMQGMQPLPPDHRTKVNQIPRSNTPKPNEMPGERLNTQPVDVPIRVDDAGRLWFQEEIRKSGFAKPRGRRVLKYMDSGVETKTVQNGDYLESFEVGGLREVPSEVKVTMPSYQVGIYKDPNLPFKINVYDSRQGFDLEEVQAYYGGSDLVPEEVKRVYVSNVLCYDIRTVIRAIETEFRRQRLANQNGI